MIHRPQSFKIAEKRFRWATSRLKLQVRFGLLLLVIPLLLQGTLYSQQPSAPEVQAAMKKATQFMLEKIAYRGGYVWSVSEDFSRRDGEVPARGTQIWIQGGTPDVANAYLDAYEATRDPLFLEAARQAADALVYGQRPEGGWHYFIDFDPKGIEEWYKKEASRFKWGYEEYRHYYGNATFDDGNSALAARFLLRFYMTTLESAYRAPVIKAFDFFLKAQFPNGAWPQRYPLRYEFAHDGMPDYTSYYTPNDGAMVANILTLVEGYEKLGDERYLEAAKRGVDFLITVQGPEGQAAWAEQFAPNMEPTAARTHEPSGFVIRESVEIIELLETFYLMTGSTRYLRPIPGALAWFERVNREALEFKRPVGRYYQLGTNLPVYVIRTDKTNADGYGLYQWSTTNARGDGLGLYRTTVEEPQIKPALDVAPIRKEYERISKLTPEEARTEYERRAGNRRPNSTPRAPAAASVAEIIKTLDDRGAWISNDIQVLTRVVPPAMNPGTREPMRGFSTAVFIKNLRILTNHIQGLK